MMERLPDEETADTAMAIVREVLRFDPSVNRYTPKMLEQVRAYRARNRQARLNAQ